MWRNRFAAFFLVFGALLLLASLGQYGYMVFRQHRLRQQWNALDAVAASPGSASHSPAAGLRLIIPSIHLDDVVVRGTAYQDLLVAPGLLDGTPFPNAASGNTVIAGHRDTFFRHVAELRPGAEILLRSRGRTYDYRVSHTEVVDPTQTQVLAPTPRPRLTLVTCYPTGWIGPAPQRFIVQAALIGVR